jgi:predicted short-subunit dehydrogenase-like oxidoreductase (DUF2520 family)
MEHARKVAKQINPRPEILTEFEFADVMTDIIFIATQDSEIFNVGKLLAKELEQMPFVFHTSGAKSSEILADLKTAGYDVGSFHPLVSISDSFKGSSVFHGVPICIEGTKGCNDVGEHLAEVLRGKPFKIPSEFKPLYHASAVMACGHLVTLISLAIEMLEKCGLEAGEAKNLLRPLIDSTVSNTYKQTPAEALTGTFARADLETMMMHLTAIQEHMPAETQQVYKKLGLASLKLAEEKGADSDLLREMSQLLK